ncbi:MAG: hypothetical protein AAF664_25060 [Planctomycetota bacterium]
MRKYSFEENEIEVQLRPFGIFLWLFVGFVVRIDGRTFTPNLDRVGLNTQTDFLIRIGDRELDGVVRSLGPMWFLPRMRYSITVDGSEIVRDVQTLNRWYVSYSMMGLVIFTCLLALIGALFIALIILRFVQ